VLRALDSDALADNSCLFGGGTAMATSKLLANSDRWRDDAVMSRDLIDLAMMAPSKGLMTQAMALTHVSKAALWARIRALVR